MKRKYTLLVIAVLLLSMGCTTTMRNVEVNSTPQGVPFTVYNRKNEIVAEGHTPQTIQLPYMESFLDRAYYVIYRHPVILDEGRLIYLLYGKNQPGVQATLHLIENIYDW